MAGTFRDVAFFRPRDLVGLGGWSNDTQGPKRTVRNDVGALVAGASTLLLAANPTRIAAILTNWGSLDVGIAFGEGAAANYGILLRPGGSFQIDKDFPWCGEVYGSATGNCYVRGIELSIDG